VAPPPLACQRNVASNTQNKKLNCLFRGVEPRHVAPPRSVTMQTQSIKIWQSFPSQKERHCPRDLRTPLLRHRICLRESSSNPKGDSRGFGSVIVLPLLTSCQHQPTTCEHHKHTHISPANSPRESNSSYSSDSQKIVEPLIF
jgi:hypothetical protein